MLFYENCIMPHNQYQKSVRNRDADFKMDHHTIFDCFPHD